MKPDYKNWIPKGMMFSLIAGTALSLALLLVFGAFGICVSGKLRVVLGVVFGIAFVMPPFSFILSEREGLEKLFISCSQFVYSCNCRVK